MRLIEIVNGINYKLFGDINQEVTDIKIDSRKVTTNAMYIAISGDTFDGNNFINEAIINGASVVVTNKKLPVNKGITLIIVEDTRIAYSIFCNNFFNNPNKKLKTIAVVGTNGKTTTTYILKSVLESAGKKVGVIGTLGANYNKQNYNTGFTTPDSYDLNKYLYDMANNAVEYAIIEVSAHAIYYNKTYGIKFDYAIFTNFSEDHLDFFGNMTNYFFTKLSFFNTKNVKLAVVNSDDFLGEEIITNNTNLLKELKEDNCNYNKDFFNKNKFLSSFDKFKKLQKVSYGIDNPSDVFAIDISSNNIGTEFVVNAFDKIYDIKSSLIGRYNVYNLLSAITLLEVIGIGYQDIYKGINNLKEVKGRMNFVNYKDKHIVIDFAHTEDGLKNLLTTLRELTKGKILLVFGCGGNRDKIKRSKMGEVASLYSDEIILTSDNPRYENALSIINDISKGISRKYTTIIDRFEAIKYGIGRLSKEDLLVIAGKGAEQTQEINGIFYPFNDKEVVQKILRIKK